MRIAYISLASPFSRTSWSGIPWYSHREILRRFPDTHVIETPRLDWAVEHASSLDHLGVQIRRNPWLAHHYSRAVNAILKRVQPDVVLGVAAAHKLAYIDPKWPLVYTADAMYGSMIDYYPKYAKLSSRARDRGNSIQASMLERADKILLSSQWAIDTARNVYAIDDGRLRLVPMGANLDEDPGYSPPRLGRPLSVLFVGYDWERKGGHLALETWRELRARTGNAEFHIVGAHPPAAEGLEGVLLHGRLNKAHRQEFSRLHELYDQSHFFLLPSHQEAYGIALCEAAAFGRPAVAHATGGVTTVVKDGETGLLAPEGTSASELAQRILTVWGDSERYVRLCEAARKRFETHLNWSTWGDSTAEILASVVAERHAVRR